MGDRLRNPVQNIGHNLELYATLVVCGFLLVLKTLHLVEDHWIYSAILITLMLLALGNLRDRAGEKALHRTLERIASQGRGEETVRWYTVRSEATADMLADMEKFKHIAFLGISHRQLPTYLDERLQKTQGSLPWETVEVYFASPALGEAYEGAAFRQNLMKARQDIASLLTDPAFVARLPHLRSVEFLQQNGFATHTGAMFGANSRELAVIYAVHSAVHLHGNTHQGLTIRLSASPGLGFEDARFEHYEGIYRALTQSSVRLGVFTHSIWDSSAMQWSDYARQSDVLHQSADVVARMISPEAGDSVLDIGSGSGESANAILSQHNQMGVSFTLLDGSPQMVRILRNKFQHVPQVNFALCQLPPVDRSSIDLGDARFSFIVIHQTLRELGRSFGSLDEVAVWCRSRLRPNGQLLVTAHNTFVVIPINGWINWQDPFRADLAKEFRKTVARTAFRAVQAPIDQVKVEEAFQRGGFKLLDRKVTVIDVTWEERRRLWKVPAVMDSFLDTTSMPAKDRDQIVDRIIETHKQRGTRTMPRSVVIWKFLPVDSHEREAGARPSEAG
ncbi:MAG: class I SAM-dependent methyltransferase [Candidatus Zixiibacteriota bacterium]